MGQEAEQLLIAGNELFSESRFDEALSKYEQAMQSLPDYVEAINNYGLTLARQNKHKEAITKFLKALEINPSYPPALVNLGLSYSETGDTGKAIEYMEKAINIDPGNYEYYNYYGNILLNVQRFDDAIKNYKKALDIKPDFIYAAYNWGLALDRNEKWDKAIEKYNKAISIDPSYLPSYQNLAAIYSKKDNYNKAVRTYEKLINKFPDSVIDRVKYAKILAKLSRHEEAVAEYIRAIKLNTVEGFYPDELADSIKELKSRRKIISEIQTEIEKQSDADLLNKLGNLFFFLDMFPEAVEQYKKAVSIKPDYIYAHHNWGLALNRLKKYNEAVAHFKGALNINPEYMESIRNLGEAYFKSGKYEAAAEEYKKVISLKGENDYTRLDLANSLYKAGKEKEALIEFYAALEKNPRDTLINENLISIVKNNSNQQQVFFEIQAIVDEHNKADIYNDWGNVYFSLCMYEEAIKQYNFSLQEDPQFVYAFHNLGLCYFNLKEYVSAVEQYKNAIDANKNYPSTYFNYAYLLDRLGDYGQARVFWEKAVDAYENSSQDALDNKLTDHFYYYGDIVHSVINDYSRAEHIYKKGLSLDQDYLPILLNLTNLYSDIKENISGKDEKSNAARVKAHLELLNSIRKTEKLISSSISTDENYNILLDAADLYLIKGEYDKAIGMLTKALDYNNTSATGYSKLGNVYFITGKYKKSINYLEQALDLDPDNLNLHSELADAYLAVERTDEAESIYKKILSVAPNHVESYRGLGKIYSDYGDKDDPDMFKEAVTNFTRALNIAQSVKSSKSLKKKEIAELYYSRGYARVKMYEAEKTFDESLLKSALEDFRNCYSCDPDNHRAKRAQEKIEKSFTSKPTRWLSEKFGPAVIFTFSFLCLLFAQFLFFAGKPLIGEKNFTIQKLRNEEIPADIVKSLSPLQGKKYSDRATLIRKIKEYTGENNYNKFNAEITNEIESEMGITAYQPIESGYYVLLTFGSLIFMITGLYLPQVLKLKVGGIELEKSAIDQMKSTISLGITKGTVDQTKKNLNIRISKVT